MTSKIFAGILLSVSLLLIGSARAADGVGTSGYTLFNPVPDDQLRELSPDRPLKASSPITVDAGHLMYEADFALWNYDHYNAQHQTLSDFTIGDPEFKLGLTHDIDIEIAGAPLNVFDTKDRQSGAHDTAVGFGDLYGRMKVNFLGNDGGAYAFGVTPFVKAPTATSSSIGNGHWEGGAYAPLNIELPNDWIMTAQTEFDLLENAANDGVHPNYINLINIGHPILTKDLSAYAEFWSDVNADRNTPTQYSADFALAWLAGKNLQFDAGFNLGLNKATPDVQSYFGIAQRF